MTAPVAFTIACALATCALIAAEYRKSDAGRYAFKPLAAAGFMATGIALADGSPFATWILVGLAFGAGGDVALMLKPKPAFTVGLFLFLVGHAAYIVAVAQVVPPAEWASPLAALPIVAAVPVTLWLWPHLGRMRGPVALYIAVIVAMVVAALATGNTVLIAGAALFFASDLGVARRRFIDDGFINKALGQPAYFAGQLLFAWTLAG